MTPDSLRTPVDDLLSGPRGRRLCLEYAAAMGADVHTTLFWLAHFADPHPGTLFSVGGNGQDPEIPDLRPEDLVIALRAIDLAATDEDAVRLALRMSVDRAMYWQPPDGADVVAAMPAVLEALRPVAAAVVTSRTAAGWSSPLRSEQWAVDWREPTDASPLPSDPSTRLAQWTAALHDDEERAARERPRDVRANWSGNWWSLPYDLLTTRGDVIDALDLVEDSLGWEVATVIPVRGAGRVLEIRSPDDWADLCRRYPIEVTASRRHDWFRVTGRDGRWVIPDWQQVSADWDVVHLSTAAYLRSATMLIPVDAEFASVIGGWSPDAAVWLTDTAREREEPRQHWSRDTDSAEWIRS